MYRRTIFFALTTALALLVFAGVASATTVKGKVVHRNLNAHSFVVARSTGQLVSVHARRSPTPGRRVVVQGRVLQNGTLGAASIVRGTLAHHARIHGVVTYVNQKRSRFVVSAHGVSLVVRRGALGAGRAAGEVPAAGDVVTVDATVDDQGDIAAEDIQDEGSDAGATDLEGQVLSVDLEARTLTLSADDDGELAGTITLNIPDGWDMTAYAVGDELEVSATLNADGTYTALGTSENGDAQEADDQGGDQGDDSQGGDDQGGDQGDQQDVLQLN